MYSFLLLILLFESNALKQVSENLRQKLDAEEENAICCENNLPCCKESGQSGDFEVKSIITNCPDLKCANWSTTHKIVIQQNKKPDTEKLTECTQKLLLTIRMTSEGISNNRSQYVIIDHIIDSFSLKKVRILNPYAVRIRQDPVLEVYDLKFERAVNAEAKEKVLNKHDRSYRGCDTSSENPTCGLVQSDGRILPYSTGFCCSCDAEKNRILEEKEKVQWPVPDYHKNHPEENNYQHYKHYGFTEEDDGIVPKRADKSVNYQQFTELKDGKIRQRRGGQSCDDVNELPEEIHESTHCLTFSNLWYSVYQLGKPRIVHRLKIQIFQKYEDCHGNTHWMDLTQGNVIELSTSKPNYYEKNILAKYSSEECEHEQALDYSSVKLLIPEKRLVDPNQFMILPKKMVSEDGKTCDTAGVGYEAFYKQSKRCAKRQGSCLDNQPQQLYQTDLEAQKGGKAGNYFLKFYGSLADDPIVYNSTGQIQYLKMVYTKKHVSNLYFELNADLVTLLKPNAFATITEIYTDATNPSKSRIIVKVTNSGLLYGIYYVRLSSCPLDVPASFNNIASKSVLITPQHQHVFNLYIEYPLSMKDFFCSIHVHNINQELLAVRQVRFRTYDRCICIWHCECACYVADKGLKCTSMTLDAYHAAGFQGGFSTPTHLVESSYLDEMLAMLFNMFLFLILTLLLMGLIKALLGLCSKEIGLWGLDVILGIEKPDVVCDNQECEYRDDTGISVATQFCLNILFFLLYPLALFNICIRKYCFASYTMEEDCSCEQRWINYECDDEMCPVNSSKSMNEDKNSEYSMKYTTSGEKTSEKDSKND